MGNHGELFVDEGQIPKVLTPTDLTLMVLLPPNPEAAEDSEVVWRLRGQSPKVLTLKVLLPLNPEAVEHSGAVWRLKVEPD